MIAIEGCIVVIVGLFLLGLIIMFFQSYPVFATIITIVLIGVAIYFGDLARKQKDEEKKQREENVERGMKAYMDVYSFVVIPENAPRIIYKEGFPDLCGGSNYVWIEKNNLCFFPADPPGNDSPELVRKIIKHEIPIDKIEYYTMQGEIVHETKITGGGGGGSSLGGAIVGGVIAGGAGAIIGSRKETNPINSQLVTHDKRETVLIYLDHINVERKMIFNPGAYAIFEKMLPQKSFRIVDAVRTNKLLQEQLHHSSIPDQIKELAKLRDGGILTEEEYGEKKKALLDKM